MPDQTVLARELEPPGRALLALLAEELLDEVTVHAEHRHGRAETFRERKRPRAAGPLHELLRLFDRQPERCGERLDGLRTADGRARENAVGREACQHRDEALGLADAALVEGTEAIVALPARPVAGGRMPEEEERHGSASCAQDSSRSRSRS